MDLLSNVILAQQDLINNNRNRVSVCLCIDISKSMLLKGRIAKVNNGVRKFIEDNKNDPYAAGAIDLCIVTFGGQKAVVHQPFTNVRNIQYQDLRPYGGTPLGNAVELAIQEIRDNQRRYQDYGISSFKPWLIIMSDGRSDDDISAAVEKVHAELKARRIKVMCVDMSDENEASDLGRFTLDGSVETIHALEIEDFFGMLSRSAAGLSSEVPGEDGDVKIF